MNKINLIIAIFIISVLYACKKTSDSVTTTSTTLKLIQNNWIVDSLVSYSNPDFSGQGTKIEGIHGNNDFRIDGKEYVNHTFNFGGGTQSRLDTFAYNLSDDGKYLITHKITNGVPSTAELKGIINSINESIFIGSDISNNGSGYYTRWYFHK